MASLLDDDDDELDPAMLAGELAQGGTAAAAEAPTLPDPQPPAQSSASPPVVPSPFNEAAVAATASLIGSDAAAGAGPDVARVASLSGWMAPGSTSPAKVGLGVASPGPPIPEEPEEEEAPLG
jgi:hypothetical protein